MRSLKYSPPKRPSTTKFDNFILTASQTNPKENLIIGAGVVLIFSPKYMLAHAFLLLEPCTISVVEYNTLLTGMKIDHELSARYLDAYNDSVLDIWNLTVTRCSLSIRFVVISRSITKTWCHAMPQLLRLRGCSRLSIFSTSLAIKIRMQMLCLPLLYR